MIRIIRLAAAAAVFAALPGAAFAELKIGTVDLQRALNEVEDGKTAKDKLKKDFDKKQTDLDGESEKLKREKDDLEKKAMVLNDDEKRKRFTELQQKVLDLAKKKEQWQYELQRMQDELMAGILKQMQQVVYKIAADEKFDLVLEASENRVLFHKPEFDLTDKVVKIYNSQFGKGAKPK